MVKCLNRLFHLALHPKRQGFDLWVTKTRALRIEDDTKLKIG
jgi:hypothetical protein